MNISTEKDVTYFLESRGYVCTGKTFDNTDLFSKQVENIKLVCRRNKNDAFFYTAFALDLKFENRSKGILSSFDVNFSIHIALIYASFDQSESKLIRMAKAFYEK